VQWGKEPRLRKSRNLKRKVLFFLKRRVAVSPKRHSKLWILIEKGWESLGRHMSLIDEGYGREKVYRAG